MTAKPKQQKDSTLRGNEQRTAQSTGIEAANTIAREVVNDFNLRSAKEMGRHGEQPGFDYLYKVEDGEITLIWAVVSTIYGYVDLQFSLSDIAWDLVRLYRMLVNESESRSVLHTSVIYELEKRKIDMRTLLCVDPEEIDAKTVEFVKGVLGLFLQNVPLLTRCSVIDALGHSKIGYLRYFLKRSLQGHWHQLGLPSDFNLVTQSQIDTLRQYDLKQKMWFLGDRRQLLNEDTLPGEADTLRKQYKVAKKFYKKLEKSSGLTGEQLNKEWIELQIREFLVLRPTALDQIATRSPSELAIVHLAETYDYEEDTIRKKLASSRRKRVKLT